VFDVAGNSASTGPFGPFWVDKKPPVISAITVSPVIPILGAAGDGELQLFGRRFWSGAVRVGELRRRG